MKSTSTSSSSYPENIPGIHLLKEEGEWKYIDLSKGPDAESLLQMLRAMPLNRELCFFEYHTDERMGDTSGLYVMLQVYQGACYFWKGNHGRSSSLEQSSFEEAVAMIQKNTVQEDAFLYLVPAARRFELRPDFRWSEAPERAPDGPGELVRHLLATLAFRFQRVVRTKEGELVEEEFGDFLAGNGVRSPKEIVQHMRGVLGFMRAEMTGEPRPRVGQLPWKEEIEGFHTVLQGLDTLFLKDSHPERITKRLLQGPITDAFTHIGQLAMLRRLYGNPVEGMNFFSAEIRTGNVAG